MALQLTTFDVADYLDSEEAIAEYLSQVMADGDDDELLRALGHVAKARGRPPAAPPIVSTGRCIGAHWISGDAGYRAIPVDGVSVGIEWRISPPGHPGIRLEYPDAPAG